MAKEKEPSHGFGPSGEKPVWYLMGWNEGHGFFKPANINFLLEARARFVKECLLR